MQQSHEKPVSILQTGRIGDLWFALPLCKYLHDQGRDVEVVYDAQFGEPFTYVPYVRARPIIVQRPFSRDRGWSHFWNEAIIQTKWLRVLKQEGREVIWNQVFPFHWPGAVMRRIPYPVYWYRRYPQINFRRAETTLDVSAGDRILVFRHSQSLKMTEDAAYFDWIDRNLQKVVGATGLTPLVVAYGNQPDHDRYETWRGSMDEYQQLIAGCGMVYGVSTSAHVLGQLLGKPIVTLYSKRRLVIDSIGEENVTLVEGSDIKPDDLTVLGCSSVGNEASIDGGSE